MSSIVVSIGERVPIRWTSNGVRNVSTLNIGSSTGLRRVNMGVTRLGPKNFNRAAKKVIPAPRINLER